MVDKETFKLDIACGQNKQEGFRGIDISDEVDADYVHDLTQYPWPIEDNSVEAAFCSHYVEHTPLEVKTAEGKTCDGLIAFMNEVYRILIPGAQFQILHPFVKSVRAFQDPTHRRFIPSETWWYFHQAWLKANGLDHYPINCDFEIISAVSEVVPPYNVKHELVQQFATNHYWEAIGDLSVMLKSLKPE